MLCPNCGSSSIKMISSTYPEAYECEVCGLIFLLLPNAFIDEGV